MSIVMCSRCDRTVDLDYDVESMVVLSDGINYACRDCLEENEVCAECGEPRWEKCGCKSTKYKTHGIDTYNNRGPYYKARTK
jgi:hypothetical protein